MQPSQTAIYLSKQDTVQATLSKINLFINIVLFWGCAAVSRRILNPDDPEFTLDMLHKHGAKSCIKPSVKPHFFQSTLVAFLYELLTAEIATTNFFFFLNLIISYEWVNLHF